MNDDDGAPRSPTRGQGVRPRAQTRLELKLQAARTTLYKELGLGDVDQPLIPGILKTQLECRLQRVPRGLRDTRPTITSRLLLLRPSPPGPAPAPPSHQAALQPAPDAARAWGSPPREAMLPSSPMAPVTAHRSASQPVGGAQATRPLSPLAADPPPTGPPRGHPVAPAHPPAARRGSGRRPTGPGGEQQVVATALGAQGGRRAPFMRQPLTLLPGPTRQWQADKALYYTPISQRASQPPAAFPASLRQGMLMYFSPMEQELALQGWDKVDQQLRHLREAEVAAWNTQQLQERSGRPGRQTGAAGQGGGGGGSPEHDPWSGPDVEEEGGEGVQQMGVDQVLTHKVAALAHQLCLHPAVLWHLLEAEQSEEGVGEEGEEEQQQGAEAGQQQGAEAGGETHKADAGQQQRTGSAAAQPPHTSLVLSQQPQPQSLPSNSNDQQGSNSKARDALKARGSREAALGKDLPPLHHARRSVTQGVRHVAGVTHSPGHLAGSAPMAGLGAQDATQLLALLQKNYALHHQQASGQASLPPGVDGSALIQQAMQAVRLMKLEGEGEGLGGGGGQWGAEDDVLGSLRALWRERQLKRRSRGQGANAMAAATGNSLPSPAPPLGSPPCTRIITWAQPSPPHPPPPPPHGPDHPQDPPTRSPLRPRLASHPPNTASQVSPLAVGTSSRSSTSSTSEVKGQDRLQEAAGEGQRPGSAPSPSMQPLGPDPSPDSGPGTQRPALKPLQSLSCSSLEAAGARPPALPQAEHQQQQQPAEQQGQQQRGQQQGWAGEPGRHQPAEGRQQQQVLGGRRSLSPTGLVMSRRYQDAADREQWQPLAPGASRPSLLQPWGYQACLLDNSLAMQIAAQQPLPVQSEAQAGTQLGRMGGQGRSLEGTLAAAARPEAGAPHGSGHEAGASVPGPLPGSHFVAPVTPAPPTDYPALRRSIARHAGARPAGVTAADKNVAPGTRDSAPSDHDSVPGAGRHAASCDPLLSGNVGSEAAEAVMNPPHPLPPRNPKKGTGAPQQAAGSEGACAGGGAGTEADKGGRGQVASQEKEASLNPPAQGASSAPQGSHSPTPRPGAHPAQVAVRQAGRGRARQQPGGRQVLGSIPLHPHPQPASPSGCQPPSSTAVQLPAATLTPPGPPDAQQQGVPQATQAATPLALPPAAATAATAAAGGIRDGMHGLGQRGDLTAATSPLLPPPSLATQAPPCHSPTPLAIPPSSVLADNLSPLLAGELSKLRSACAPEFVGQRTVAPAGRAARADAAGRYQPAAPLLTLVSDIAESRKMVTELYDARQVMLLLRGAEQQLRPRQLKALRQRQQQQQQRGA